MKQVRKSRTIRSLAVVAFAALPVSVAQAGNVAMVDGGNWSRATSSPALSEQSLQFRQSQAPTAVGLKADGLRLQAEAQAYQSQAGTTALGLKADGQRLQAEAQAYQSVPAATPATYPFYSENSAGFKQAEQASRPAQAVSENSPLYSSPRVSPQPVATGGRGIDWRDTGIGAGLAALIASIVSVGAGAAIGRGRGRAAHA